MSADAPADAPLPTGAASFDQKSLHKLARLARLTTTEAEEVRLAGEMAKILDYMARLQALPLQGVPPTSHAVDLPTKLRKDEVRPGLPIEAVMRNAPERLGDGFGVPKIIE